MKLYLILMSLVTTSAACNNVSSINQNKYSLMIDTIFEPPPPPISVLKTPSQTLEQWFNKLCDTTVKSNETIVYQFGLFDTPNQDYYALYLIDLAEYKREHLGESPVIKYYLIDRVSYKGLDWRQVLELMRKQLLELSKTERFKTTAISKAKSIIIRFDDLEILKLK